MFAAGILVRFLRGRNASDWRGGSSSLNFELQQLLAYRFWQRAAGTGQDRRACVVRSCGMRLPGWNVGKCVSVRGGLTRDVDVYVDGDDDEDRAGGKLFTDSSDDNNESYTGVTHCLQGISSRNWELGAVEYFTRRYARQ